MYRSNGQGLDWSVKIILTYDKKFGGHSISALLGQRCICVGIGNFSGVTHYNPYQPMIMQASFNMAVAPTDKLGNSYNFNQVRRASLFARLNYNYKEKYLLTGIIRRDGSSLFGPNNKFGNFLLYQQVG